MNVNKFYISTMENSLEIHFPSLIAFIATVTLKENKLPFSGGRMPLEQI